MLNSNIVSLYVRHVALVYCDNDKETIQNMVKGKAVPLQAWSDTEGSRKLRLPDSLTQDGGKVVSLTHRLHLLPGNTPVTHF
jgi:hypothetical protein